MPRQLRQLRWRRLGVALLAVVCCGTEQTSLAGEHVSVDRWPLSTEWHLRMDPADVGVAEGWQMQAPEIHAPDRPSPDKAPPSKTSWRPIKVPGHWEDLTGEDYDGVGWYTATFEAPEPRDGARRGMCLMGVDDAATVFLNGRQLLPALAYLQPMAFDLEELLREGENRIHVRVVDHGGEGGLVRNVYLGRFTNHASELCRSETSLKQARESADWVRPAVIYEVFLRSFSPEGTLKALTERLDELDKLGVTVLWLMPIHPTGEKHRKGPLGSPYSVRDYLSIDPAYGDLDDMRALVKAAHQRQMKVIIDWVANHSAWDHAWINAKPDYYTRDENGKMQSPVKEWTDVADLNYASTELRGEMSDSLVYWVADVGIDGYRCDVADMVPRDFWESVRTELDAIKPVMLLAEADNPELHLKAFDLSYDWGLYQILGELKTDKLTPRRLRRHFDELDSLFPRHTLMMRFSTNHDLNAWDAPAIQRYGPEAARAAATLVFCLPGVPMIYNGQEAANNKPLGLFEAVKIDWSADDHGLRDLYTNLAALREEFPSLASDQYEIVDAEAGDRVLRLVRGTGAETLLLLMNFTQAPQTIELTGRLAIFEEEVLRSPNVRRMAGKVKLPPLGYWIAATPQAFED